MLVLALALALSEPSSALGSHARTPIEIASLSSELSSAAAKAARRGATNQFEELTRFLREVLARKEAGIIGKRVLGHFGIDVALWDAMTILAKNPKILESLSAVEPESKTISVIKSIYAKSYVSNCSQYETPKNALSLIQLSSYASNSPTKRDVCITLHNIHVSLFWITLRKLPPGTFQRSSS